GKAVGVQAFLQLGVPLDIGFGIVFGIGGLSLLGANIHPLPVDQRCLTLLGRLGAAGREDECSNQRESETVHQTPPSIGRGRATTPMPGSYSSPAQAAVAPEKNLGLHGLR